MSIQIPTIDDTREIIRDELIQFKMELTKELRELIGSEYDGVEISGVEAARMLGVTSQTVSEWKKDKKLGEYVNGVWVITLGSVKRKKAGK